MVESIYLPLSSTKPPTPTRSPATMRMASPSAMAVLPTPGSPISTGLFLGFVVGELSFAVSSPGRGPVVSLTRRRQPWGSKNQRKPVQSVETPIGCKGEAFAYACLVWGEDRLFSTPVGCVVAPSISYTHPYIRNSIDNSSSHKCHQVEFQGRKWIQNAEISMAA